MWHPINLAEKLDPAPLLVPDPFPLMCVPFISSPELDGRGQTRQNSDRYLLLGRSAA